MTETQTISENEMQNINITDLFKLVNLPNSLLASYVIINEDRIYLIGGRNENNCLNTVYTTTINDDGSLNEWVTLNPLPKPLIHHQCTIIKNHLYTIGGLVNEDNLTDTVYMTTINEDGTLNEWTVGNPLPLKLFGHKVITTDKYVYVLGGVTYKDTLTDNIEIIPEFIPNVYRAKINDNGSLDIWEKHSTLPGFLAFFEAIIVKNRIYLLGGDNGSRIWSGVYTTEIDNEGNLGKWTTSSPLPEPSYSPYRIIVKDRIYLITINNERKSSDIVYTTTIDNNGILGKWEVSAILSDCSNNPKLYFIDHRKIL